MSAKFFELGFSASKVDTSLFYFNKGNVTIFLLIYVDDIIVVSSSQEACSALLRNLSQDFVLKDLGRLNYFFGIEVSKVRDGIVLTQNKYASDLLKRVGMSDCKPVNTPLLASEKLSAFDGTPLAPDDATRYRSIVGALQHLTLTRSDIAFSAKKSLSVFACPYNDSLASSKTDTQVLETVN